MKKTIIFLVIFFSLISAQGNNSGKIQIDIVDLSSDEGVVRIALYNSYDSYTNTGKAFKSLELKIKGKKTTAVFENLPFGEYAIRLFHDENNNNEFDTGMFGIPTEDYAFSNNATGSMGPASYEDAKFKLDKEYVNQELTVR